MNERIKELALQARNYALDEKRIYERIHNTEQCMEEYREVYNKKFAELIVRECADLFDKNETEVQIPEHRIHNSIMIHFGLY
jgi:hypothetical protein